jgi:hypothetical protein
LLQANHLLNPRRVEEAAAAHPVAEELRETLSLREVPLS